MSNCKRFSLVLITGIIISFGNILDSVGLHSPLYIYIRIQQSRVYLPGFQVSAVSHFCHVLPVVAFGFHFELYITVEYTQSSGEKKYEFLRHGCTCFRKISVIASICTLSLRHLLFNGLCE